ncbi:MAG: FAD-dependent oxidoreductase [Variovorax sp.]|nr:FAD-dependent oxidoreductase [Variovorax sp.]
MAVAKSFGIAGAGLLGRLLAWRLARAGHAVTVFDPADSAAPRFDGQGAAGFTAAGMLSPLAELDNATADIAARGLRSIGLWRDIVRQLPGPPFFAERGSLMLAHRADRSSAERVLARLGSHSVAGLRAPQSLDAAALAALEPAVSGAAHAWLLPGEAQIDAAAAMAALHDGADGVRWCWQRRVTELEPGALHVDGLGWRRFDRVFDVRGVGAQPALPVRGVRGETVWLHAPGLGLTRPVRLLHPRHRVYVVPRPGDVVIVGASEIESEDRSPVSLQSAVELMAAAHSILPALAEARILRLDRNLRPALPDHAPLVDVRDGLVRINGLFRHGWLLAPALVDEALSA